MKDGESVRLFHSGRGFSADPDPGMVVVRDPQGPGGRLVSSLSSPLPSLGRPPRFTVRSFTEGGWEADRLGRVAW